MGVSAHSKIRLYKTRSYSYRASIHIIIERFGLERTFKPTQLQSTALAWSNLALSTFRDGAFTARWLPVFPFPLSFYIQCENSPATQCSDGSCCNHCYGDIVTWICSSHPRSIWWGQHKYISTHPMEIEIFLTRFTKQSGWSREVVTISALAWNKEWW